MVSPTLRHLARRAPLSSLVLTPPGPTRRCELCHRAGRGHGDCAQCARPRAASQAGWADYVGRMPDLWPMWPVAVRGPQAFVGMSQRPAQNRLTLFLFLYSIKYLQKFL
jgi:hypothetical protein